MMIICTSNAMAGVVREADEETETWFQSWVPVDGERLGLMIYPKDSWMAIAYVPQVQPQYVPIFMLPEHEPTDDFEEDA